MNILYADYKDKVLGCLYGKTIGGTLGAPFECYRGVYDVTFYTQDTSKPVPNDDVDLQLVWLRAVELERGRIDAMVLAEYWSTYISASLSEYGTGKNNFRMGIRPPLSGHLRNRNRDSNGAWIRSEIWALCPRRRKGRSQRRGRIFGNFSCGDAGGCLRRERSLQID